MHSEEAREGAVMSIWDEHDETEMEVSCRARPTGLCQVCGDKAGGRYFNAVVCIPCKAFYLRMALDINCQIEPCEQGGCCEITPTSRSCRFCRYQRCLTVGMCRRERPMPVISEDGRRACLVCGDTANGLHFGVQTCEGCKKFFRRAVREGGRYVCKANATCEVNMRTRNACRYCRYRKCLDLGMSLKAVHIGRPTRLVATPYKHTYTRHPRPYFSKRSLPKFRSNAVSRPYRRNLTLPFQAHHFSSTQQSIPGLPPLIPSTEWMKAMTESVHELQGHTRWPTVRNCESLRKPPALVPACAATNENRNSICVCGAKQCDANIYSANRNHNTSNENNFRTGSIMSKSNSGNLSLTSEVSYSSDEFTISSCDGRRNSMDEKLDDDEDSDDDCNIIQTKQANIHFSPINSFDSSSYWLNSILPNTENGLTHQDLQLIQRIVIEYEKYRCCLEKLNRHTTEACNQACAPVGDTNQPNDSTTWLDLVVLYTKISCKYIVTLPGFGTLLPEDQLVLLRHGEGAAIILLAAIHWYDSNAKTFQPDFYSCVPPPDRHDYKMYNQWLELSSKLNSLNMDTFEASLLNVVVIIASDVPGLSNTDKVEELRKPLLKAFMAFINAKYGNENNRIQRIFSLIPEVRKLAAERWLMTQNVVFREESSM